MTGCWGDSFVAVVPTIARGETVLSAAGLAKPGLAQRLQDGAQLPAASAEIGPAGSLSYIYPKAADKAFNRKQR